MAKQLPLFHKQPASAVDISKNSALGATFPQFEAYLLIEGKSRHAIDAFRADMNLLGEHVDLATPISNLSTHVPNAFLGWMERERGVPCSRKTYARRVTLHSKCFSDG